MIGNWKWNFHVATATGFLTFILSWPKNPPFTSMIRALSAFMILYLAVFAIRWLWGYALKPAEPGRSPETGRKVDLATPADDESLMNEMLSGSRAGESDDGQFVPLRPEKLVTKDKLDPEILARSVRQMSED